MQVDRKIVAELLNGQLSAMFATWREASISSEALDAIVARNKPALDGIVQYLRQADMSDSDRALRINIISWSIMTIGLAAELGMVLEANTDEQGKLPAFKKD